MQHIKAEPLLYEFRNDLPARAKVQLGEVFTVESEDALSGQIRKAGDRRDKSTVPKSNPVAGPIVVEGLEPGDTMVVHIESIESRDGQCATYTGHPRRLVEWLGDATPSGEHVCPIRDGKIVWKDRIEIPYEPMLGCIAAAPDWGVPTTKPAGDYGGNLDLVEVAPGAAIHLPVRMPGGMLYVGDAHAAMGHGELSATGLEMAAITQLRIEKIAQTHVQHVRMETHNNYLAAVATGSPMEAAIAEAYARLILWMESLGWSRWDAYDLLTHVGRLSVGYYGIGTVAAKISRDYVNDNW